MCSIRTIRRRMSYGRVQKEGVEQAEEKDTLSTVIRYFDEADIDHKYLARRGLPSREIIEEANSGNYEVLIIGSRGLNIFQEMVLGSVSHRVAKYSTIPVMIVK